jgi:RimJ/RimL family protein N-acetyltransferase
MKKNITLNALNIGEEQKILEMIRSDETLENTFGTGKDRISRLLNTTYSAIINADNIPVGFVMMTDPKQTDTHEIDIGILTEYRGQGYGSEALKLLKDIIIYNQINTSVQVNKCNEPAIRAVTNNGFALVSTDEKDNFYTLETKSSKK